MATHASHTLTPGARYTGTGRASASANRARTASMTMISFSEMQSTFQATAGLRARVRARMVAQGHAVTDADFVVSTPTRYLKLAVEGVDCRRARLTCTACGEWAEIAVAAKKVAYGDAGQADRQSEATADRTALGVSRCGSAGAAVRLPLIHSAQHQPVQFGAALARCQDMQAKGHRMSRPVADRSSLYGGYVHYAVCADCGARVVDADLRTIYGFRLMPGEPVILSADIPTCGARALPAVTAAPAVAPAAPIVEREPVVETVETIEISRIAAGMGDF